MWTPKRLVLLFSGFAVFSAAYCAYALTTLGGIDGLPPLPPQYWPGGDPLIADSEPPRRTNSVNEKLKLAFGDDCPELGRIVRLELQSKKMAVAADDFAIEGDGRVKLPRFSLALFSKDQGDGSYPEVNTLRCNVAYLKFDRPVTNLSEIGNRKIVGAELGGNIQIVNNRRTRARDDDLCLYVGTGPIFYQESNHLVWTQDTIHLTDHSSKPKPIEVHGKGMEMELLAEPHPANAGAPTQKRGRSEQIAGVKKITLLSNVDMHLYVDSKSSFPGTGSPPPKKAAKDGAAAKLATPAPPQEKAHIAIKTPGRFQYELFKDHDEARFDVPHAHAATSPEDVTVTRYHERLGLIDQLVCQHLDLRLQRGEPKKNKAKEPQSGSLEQGLHIEAAHATGPEVTLTSDAEKLEAHGNDFFYDARKLMTTLKGEPRMIAVKEGNTIRAREMQIQDQKLPAQDGQPARSFQQAIALGPVSIDLIDKSNGVQKPIQASCTDRLISTKDGPNDLLILSGTARFTDEEHHQHLQADVLKVWLNPGERELAEKADRKPESKGDAASGGRRPHHIEALDNVVAVAPEMNIHDTGRLVVWFKDVPVARLPDHAKPTAGERTEARKAATAPDAASPPSAETRLTNPPPGPGSPVNPPAEKTPPRPIDLSARSVEAWVLRSGAKNQLEKLWTEGSVQVHQDPAKPDEKGVDVKGDTLELTYHPEGNLLVVTGDLAQLRLDKIYILGPEVNIDQAANKAWVVGIGAMQMESKTNFQGDELARAVPLTVHWNKSMLFNGKFAEFTGGIQAEQENARLAGQSLSVFFDRAISLKEGAKGTQPAKVQHLVCDKDVRVEEAVYEGGKLLRYQRIQTPLIAMTALEDDSPRGKDSGKAGNEVRASGPGNVRMMRRGDDPGGPNSPVRPAGSGSAPVAKPGPRKSASSDDHEMKLTYVQFLKTMYANSKTSTAIFLENVRVLNMPCEDPNLEIDLDVILDKLPPGAMYLRCDRLDVFNRGEKGRSQQEMLAKGRCMVQAKEFWGRASTITYNEAKDQVIFDGGEDGEAVLYKVDNRSQPKEIKAKKIIYLRKTGQFSIDGGTSLNAAD